MNREQTIEILNHYADPYIDHDDGTCGMCERQKASKTAAKEELEKSEPNFDDFMKRSKEIWEQSLHFKTWQEISAGLPGDLPANERMDKITEEMRKRGLEP